MNRHIFFYLKIILNLISISVLVQITINLESRVRNKDSFHTRQYTTDYSTPTKVQGTFHRVNQKIFQSFA